LNSLGGTKDILANFSKMIEKILSQKNLKALMRCFYQEVPKFLGFQDISVMFYDYERELLYTITFGDDEDNLKDL
jgi:hypothetical protein